MFAYCGNNPVTGYDPTGMINWGGLAVGLGIAAVSIGLAALTIATAGAASPLLAAAVTTIGTVATAATAEAAVTTTYAAYAETTAVYDVTIVNGNNRSGASYVYDFSNDTSEVYCHTGAQSNCEYGASFGSGIIFNYSGESSYAGEFIDISGSFKYNGANIGGGRCFSPDKNGTSAIMLNTGISLSLTNTPVNIGYDYYWRIR
jgi:hypothetical protein